MPSLLGGPPTAWAAHRRRCCRLHVPRSDRLLRLHAGRHRRRRGRQRPRHCPPTSAACPGAPAPCAVVPGLALPARHHRQHRLHRRPDAAQAWPPPMTSAAAGQNGGGRAAGAPRRAARGPELQHAACGPACARQAPGSAEPWRGSATRSHCARRGTGGDGRADAAEVAEEVGCQGSRAWLGSAAPRSEAADTARAPAAVGHPRPPAAPLALPRTEKQLRY